MIGHRCLNCIWFDKEHDSLKQIKDVPGKSEFGYCRKHFPASLSWSGHIIGIWPIVDIMDFCGEFRSVKEV